MSYLFTRLPAHKDRSPPSLTVSVEQQSDSALSAEMIDQRRNGRKGVFVRTASSASPAPRMMTKNEMPRDSLILGWDLEATMTTQEATLECNMTRKRGVVRSVCV